MRETGWRRGVVIMFVVVATAGAALAQDGGASRGVDTFGDHAGFAGGSVGQARFGGYGSRDDSTTALYLFGGYRFHRFLGASLGYLKLGTLDSGYSIPDYQPPTGEAVLRLAAGASENELDGFTAYFSTGYPIGHQGRWFGTGSAGLLRWNQKVRTGGLDGDLVKSASGISPALSLSIYCGVDAAKKWSIYGGWQHFWNVGNKGETGIEDNLDYVAVGVMYSFGGTAAAVGTP